MASNEGAGVVDEHRRLDEVANWYSATGFEARMVHASATVVAEHCRGPVVLAIGAAEGFVTRKLSARVDRVVVVELAERYAKIIRSLHLPNVEVVEQLAEEFETSERFDEVVM